MSHVSLLLDIDKERKMNDGKNSLSIERRILGKGGQYISGKADSIGIYHGAMIGEPYATFYLQRDSQGQELHEEEVLLSY